MKKNFLFLETIFKHSKLYLFTLFSYMTIINQFYVTGVAGVVGQFIDGGQQMLGAKLGHSHGHLQKSVHR